jgi:hypothetical protein
VGGTYGTYGKKRGAYRILMGKCEGTRLFERSKLGWEDNIKMFDLDNFTYFSFHLIHLFVSLRSQLCITIQSLLCTRAAFFEYFVLPENGFIEEPKDVASYNVIITA